MTLRRRILLSYSMTLGLSLVIVAFWSWFEFQELYDEAISGGVESLMDESPLWESAEIILFGGLPAALLGMLVGTWMIRRALLPIESLTEVLEKTTASNLSEPVPRSGNGDEIDRMTAVFNGMKERLGVSFTQTREFTLHASHELKTPLTIMHGTLEQMLGQAMPPDLLRERVTSMLEEVQRLSSIVGQLTFLAKADAGLLTVIQDEVALDELIRDVTEDVESLGSNLHLTVTLVHCDPIKVHGDKMRLRQLLLNLADNAVKHNKRDGSVEISLLRVQREAVLKIINTGEVLPPNLMGRAFERFFRGDVSHGTEMDGSGLGLSIALSIAQAHGGLLTMEATDDNLTAVTLRLPAV